MNFGRVKAPKAPPDATAADLYTYGAADGAGGARQRPRPQLHRTPSIRTLIARRDYLAGSPASVAVVNYVANCIGDVIGTGKWPGAQLDEAGGGPIVEPLQEGMEAD